MWPVPARHNLKVVLISGLIAVIGLLFTQRIDDATRFTTMAFIVLLITFALRMHRNDKREREAMNRQLEELQKRQQELEEDEQ